MKLRYIVGSVVVASIVGMFYTLPKEDLSKATYEKSDLSTLKAPSADDARKWLEARYTDQETGERITDEKLALIEQDLRRLPQSKSIAFYSKGPDNIGGRTRAVCVDRLWNDRIWAGGVSGGLFVSYNAADTWGRVTSYINAGASPNISSITQTIDGGLYVATGSQHEGFGGNGLWYSSDLGATWEKVPGTSNVNEVVSSDVENKVWFTTGNSGLKTWMPDDESSTTTVPTGESSCREIRISGDGQVICGFECRLQNVCIN